MFGFQRWMLMGAFGVLAGCGHAEAPLKEGARIQVQIGNQQAEVVLHDHEAAQALLAQLPLTLTLEDFNRTEKIATLPKPLKPGNAPTSCTPTRGTFAYYIPWGNICFFYRDFRASQNLIPLGTVQGDAIQLFEQSAPFTVTLSLPEPPGKAK